MIRIIRSSIVILSVACLLAASPASQAGNQSDQWYTLDLRVADSSAFFLQPSSLFLSAAGPQWLVNALSNPTTTRIQRSSFVYDSAGDPISEAAYVGTWGNAFNPDVRSFSSASFRSSGGTSALLAPNAPLAVTYQYSTSTASTAWLNTANWTGNAGHWPGVTATVNASNGASDDIATFGSLAFSGATIGINNTTAGGTFTLGAIDYLSTLNKALVIGVSTANTMSLTLTGGTLNGVANTILSNESSQNVTLQNNGGSASAVMNVALGNATNNVIQINGTGNISISSVITGTGRNLTLQGTGTGALILSGANTYTGTTTVNSGTLLVNGNQSAATGAVSVNNAGTVLGGTGTIGGATTVNTLAKITGATNGTIGTLTLSSTLTFTGSSTYQVDINATTSDKLAIGGLLDLSGLGDSINFNSLATPTAASYTLATYTGVVGIFDIQGNVPAGYSLVYLPTELDLVMTPVPEPSTWIGAALALAAVGFTQRRKLRGLVARA